jgi:hypothetical protein
MLLRLQQMHRSDLPSCLDVEAPDVLNPSFPAIEAVLGRPRNSWECRFDFHNTRGLRGHGPVMAQGDPGRQLNLHESYRQANCALRND